MMKIAYFDAQFGAAGDMLLAAFLSSGLDCLQWLERVKRIALPDGSFTIKINQTVRSGIAATKVDVECEDNYHERHLSEIEEIITGSQISDAAKDMALRIFRRLAEAESKVHGIPVDQVHFHEVGAIDAIVDIVGFAIAYDMLGINASIVSPVALGTGTTKMEHGNFPVPGPAVVNLISASGAPCSGTEVPFECLTPTGAAILTTVASAWGAPPAFTKITGTGFGAGTKDPADWPNVTRVILGEVASGPDGRSSSPTEQITVIEANIDDMSPQTLAYSMERLLEEKALDVVVLPAVMKKGRSGHVLQVLCHPKDVPRLEEIIFRETSTIGLRKYSAERSIAQREWKEVDLAAGKVRVKIARDAQGRILNVHPEFEDCAQYAKQNQQSLKDVLNECVAAFQRQSAQN